MSSNIFEEDATSARASSAGADEVYHPGSRYEAVVKEMGTARRPSKLQARAKKPEEGKVPGTNKHYKHYDLGTNASEVYMEFPDGGRREVIPRPEKRVYNDIELAPIDSGDTLLGSSGDQAKPGLEELQLLRDLYNSANQQSHDSGDPSNQESDGVDGGTVAEALNHVPSSGDYSLTDESESDESEVEAVQTKKAKGRPARKPTGKGRVKSTAPTQNGDDDKADSDDDGGDNKVGEHNRLDVTTPPLSDIDRIFSLITEHAVNEGLLEAMKVFGDQGIKVVTMCSGTEAPFVALDLIRKSLRSSDAREKFKYQHLGSAEIEPWKQAFILRNFGPPIIFRDVTDFESHAENPDDKDRYPVTAFGKRVEPPRGAHILVAGSSCVDYSTLNRVKGEWKGERGEGESARTMNGIGAYAKMYKPTVIIIENVAGAPWNMIKVFWAEKGYDTVIVKLSTVDYYLPQTRQRGYLFGVHQDIADLAGFDINQAHKEWIHLMAGFQRRASSPYSDFTLREDDPRLQSVIHSVTDNKKRGGSTDWVQCRKRHVQERVANKLGLGTPFTKRRGHPQAQLDDYADQEWALKQSKRVLDMLDIRHLDDVSRRDFDMRFKHRNINVSQNVDRDRDNRQWGIVGCVTPSGCLFDTRRGGPLTGLEILALQGFPTGDLQLEKYTSNQLQDLAGNAMSTTVIGPAILSAILACFRVHEDNDGEQQIFEVTVDEHQDSSEDQPMEDVPVREAFDERELETNPNSKDLVPLEEEFPHVHDTEKGPYSLATIVGKARDLQPLCRCEGLHRRTSEEIIYCQDCYYTCCKGCSRDTHGHKALSKLEIGTSPRPVARTFAQFLIEVLPAVLQNQNASSLLPHFDASTSEEIKVRVSEALQSKVHFQGVKFEGSWKAVYESELALLELEFVPNRHMCDTCENHEKPHLHLDVVPMWLLFAKAPADEPVESKMRKLFQHPIASMTPEQTLFSGKWKLWDRPPQQSKVRIVRAGEQVPSWERRLELEGAPFRTLNSFSAIEVSHSTSANDKAQSLIEDIAGIYQLLPDCPAPSGTLHRRVRGSGTGTAPLFLFLQSNPLQDGRLDRVVFSNSPFRRTTADARGVLAALDKSWRPVATAQVYRGQDVLCEPISQWSDSPAQKLLLPREENTVQKWVLKPNADPMSAAACVNAFSTMLLLDLTCDANAKGRLENRREICITLERKTHALSDFGWILSHSASIPRPWNSWQHIDRSKAVECKVCSPAQPCVKWVLKKTGASESVKAMESPLEAAEYENALSSRPNPAVALLRNVQGKALLDVKINITTLAHRAVAPFLVNRSPDSELESLQWRVDPYDQFGPHPKFSLPKLQSNKLDPVNKSLQQELDLGRPLWKSQLQVLAWMIDQETSPKVWDEMSLIESCLPALGWRLEAKALLRRRHVRGGVIADEVGAGKTTTSLALVKYDYQQSQTTAATQSQGTPDSEPEAQPNQDDTESHRGKLETDATLILVPKNILSQWEGEVRNCLNWRTLQPAERTGLAQKAPYYITVKDVPELQKYSHEQIKGAALVLAAWDLFGQKAYWSSLRKIACSTCTPDEPGRAFDEWLKETLPSLGTCVEALKTGAANFWTAWDSVRERAQTDHKYENFEGFLTRQTKRNFFAKERAAAKNKAGPSNAAAGNEASEDKKAMDLRIQETAQQKSQEELAGFRRDLHRQGQPMPPPVLLHMFAFRRLIVDEYTYIEGEALLALLQLDAARRWMLSGTPPIQAYDSLNTTAKLIGTQIATYDEHEGKFGFGKDAPKMSKDKSHAQEVQSYQYVASAAFKEAVYGRARDFSERFIRKNEPSQGRAGKTSSLARVDLNPSEWVTCSDVGNLAMDPDRPFGKSTTTKKVGVNKEVPASIWWLTDLVERTNGPHDARICSSVMLEEIWPVVREDAHCILTRQLAGAEEHRMEQIIKEQAGHVCSRVSEVLPLLQELWHMHRLVRHSDKGAAASFTGLRANVSGGRLADMNAVAIVESLLGYARDNEVVPALLLSKTKKNPAAAGRVNLPWDAAEMGSAAVAVKEFDLRMARVENHLEILMQGLRRLRLLKAVFGAFQKRVGDCFRCGAAAAWEVASISTACGHVVCGECASEACCAAGDEADVVPASRFAVDYVGAQVPGTVTCSRLRLAVSLVQEAIAARDSVLVFAQHQGIKNAFTEACGEAGIACLDGFEAGTAARAVERFRAAQPACLVLKVDSADAAGWNLQSANHVVFLSVPVLGSVAELDATREQAVGRCWRPGQTKQVFVYQVAATETGELDLVA